MKPDLIDEIAEKWQAEWMRKDLPIEKRPTVADCIKAGIGEYGQRVAKADAPEANGGVVVPRAKLERWQVMFETDAEYGMDAFNETHEGDKTPTENGKLHASEARDIKAMLAAAEGK